MLTSYTDNGGSIIGIAGDDFVILAGDTRHTSGYNINSRSEKKVYRLGEDSSLVLATVGFGADAKDVAQTMRRAVEVLRPSLRCLYQALSSVKMAFWMDRS